jgi:L-alanine-DL-glutamate epimerase-like enolase superfamily enzyme
MGAMKIRQIEPFAVSLPPVKPMKMAGVEIRTAENVLVRITSDAGVSGWGEAASAPGMTGETVASMIAAHKTNRFMNCSAASAGARSPFCGCSARAC